MKNFLSLLLLAVSLAFVGCNAQKSASTATATSTSTSTPNAQSERWTGPVGNRAERLDRETEKLVAALGLNEEQTIKIKSINEGFAAEMQKMRASDSRPDRTTMMKLREKNAADIKALLTKEQQVAYDKYIAERREEMRPAGGGRRGGGGRPGGGL